MANGPDDRLRIQLLHSPASLHLAGSDGGWSSARSRRFQDSATVHLGFLRCNRPISRKARLPLLNIISEYGTEYYRPNCPNDTRFLSLFFASIRRCRRQKKMFISSFFIYFFFSFFFFQFFSFPLFFALSCPLFTRFLLGLFSSSFLAGLLFESFPNPSPRFGELITFSCSLLF